MVDFPYQRVSVPMIQAGSLVGLQLLFRQCVAGTDTAEDGSNVAETPVLWIWDHQEGSIITEKYGQRFNSVNIIV